MVHTEFQRRIKPRGVSHFTSVKGVRLHYLEYGHGEPTILIVPGITSPAITWEFVAIELAKAARVLVLDVRGRGLSDKPTSGFTLEHYADDVTGVVADSAGPSAVLLGHSMGARIVAAAAARDPESALATVVVDPPLSGPDRPPYPFPLSVYLDALRNARAGATAADIARVYPTWPRRELEIRAQWLPTCDETAIIATYRNFHEEDFFGYWPRVPSPVLFVYGADSPVVTKKALPEITRRNPRAKIVGVASAGHMVPFENFEGFITPVMSFIGHWTHRR